MRLQNGWIAAALSAAALATAPAAQANNINPVKYDDKAAFEALGVIDQVTNFDLYQIDASFPLPNFSSGVLSIAGIFTQEAGALTNTPNLPRNVIFNDGYPPHQIDGTIGGHENLFAFRIGDFFAGGSASLSLYTEDGQGYGLGVSDPLAAAPGGGQLDFHGLLAPTGHYFIGFSLYDNQQGAGYDGVTGLLGLTDFEFGHTSAGGCVDTSVVCGGGGGAPEPAAWALMILGFGAVGAVMRRRRTVLV